MGKVNMRYLDAHESSSHDYSAVTRTDQEDTSQCWCLTDFGSDTFTIQQRVNMKFLDAHEGSNDHSAVMRDDQGNDSQKWIISAEPTATAANGQSWTDSQQVCTNQGKQLCAFDNICPNGEGSTPVDRATRTVNHTVNTMAFQIGEPNLATYTTTEFIAVTSPAQLYLATSPKDQLCLNSATLQSLHCR